MASLACPGLLSSRANHKQSWKQFLMEKRSCMLFQSSFTGKLLTHMTCHIIFQTIVCYCTKKHDVRHLYRSARTWLHHVMNTFDPDIDVMTRNSPLYERTNTIQIFAGRIRHGDLTTLKAWGHGVSIRPRACSGTLTLTSLKLKWEVRES